MRRVRTQTPPTGGVMRQGRERPIATAVAVSGTISVSPRWVALRPMPGGFMTPQAMSGSGPARTGANSSMAVKRLVSILQTPLARVCCAVARGTANPTGCVPPRATGSTLSTEITLPVFVYCVAPGQIDPFLFFIRRYDLRCCEGISPLFRYRQVFRAQRGRFFSGA